MFESKTQPSSSTLAESDRSIALEARKESVKQILDTAKFQYPIELIYAIGVWVNYEAICKMIIDNYQKLSKTGIIYNLVHNDPNQTISGTRLRLIVKKAIDANLPNDENETNS